MKAVLPQMIKRKNGKIINIVSGAGLNGSPNFFLYGASKSVVIVFAEGLAREISFYEIYINRITPWIGDTNFRIAKFPKGELERMVDGIPTRKLTNHEDIANM